MSDLATFQYQGATVTVRNTYDGFRFYCAELEKEYSDRETLVAALDRREKYEEQRKKERLALKCIDARSGKEYAITGIHAGTGCLTTSPRKQGYTGRTLIPDTPESRALIGQVNALKSQLRPLEARISDAEVDDGYRAPKSLDELKRTYNYAVDLLKAPLPEDPGEVEI
jgi:hypothetical protein